MTTYRFLTGAVVPVADRAALSGLSTFHLERCFGCGPANQAGLGVRPRYEGDKVVAEFEFAPRFEGGPAVAHGGAIAAFMDDLLGFVMMAHQRPAVTARLQIHYLLPVPLGLIVRGEAWLAATEGRRLFAEGVGTAPDGRRLFEADGLFFEVGFEHFSAREYHP
jgi:acyl-coenzyme A thioesterase PaaI-like protein